MIRALAVRALLVAALVGLYACVWRPYGRTAAVHSGAVPILRATAGEPPNGWTVQARPGGRRLALRGPAVDRSISWTAPAGVRFLLPALGVALLAPRRPYWLLLWGGHVALGALGLGLLCLGVAGSGVGFVLYDVLTRYLIDAFSLGVAAWAVIAECDLGPPGLEAEA